MNVNESRFSEEQIFSMIKAEMESVMPYIPYVNELLSHVDVTDWVYESVLKIEHHKNPLTSISKLMENILKAKHAHSSEVIAVLRHYPLLPLSEESLEMIVNDLQMEVFPEVPEQLPSDWVLKAWQAKTLNDKKLSCTA